MQRVQLFSQRIQFQGSRIIWAVLAGLLIASAFPSAVRPAAAQQLHSPENGCLPEIDFETDANGNPLPAGTVIDEEWAAWGVHVTSDNQSARPAMIFDSANPTGNDWDLGTPHQDFGGPGIGDGGAAGMPGANSVAQGNLLIINEDTDASDPDDWAGGGTLSFTFDQDMRVDQLSIVDIEEGTGGNYAAAFDINGNPIGQPIMLGLGDNSAQTLVMGVDGVRRLDIVLDTSGSVSGIIFCQTEAPDLVNLGDVVWHDVDRDGVQDSEETGIDGVLLVLNHAGPDGLEGTADDYYVTSATTKSDGSYIFANLPRGDYFVTVDSSNFGAGNALDGYIYTVDNSAGDDAADSDFDALTDRSHTVNLQADDMTVDAGFYNASYYDFGDLPAGYGTTSASDGARHALLAGNDATRIWLGSTVDAEADGAPTVDADGDNAAVQDDENGVAPVGYWAPDSDVSLNVSVGANTPGRNVGTMIGCLDWDGDGAFSANEFYSWDVASGAQTLPITVGSAYTLGNDLYARFRLFDPANIPGGSADLSDCTGAATNGEVEDYKWMFTTPTAVTLSGAAAQGQAAGLNLLPVLFLGLILLSVAAWQRRPALA